MAHVQINSLYKTFETTEVVKGVDIDIADGEFVVLVGPSGCGKSTLLRMIAGLETVTDGDIVIDDRRVNDIPSKNRDIAMVFQNYALYPHMTVTDNMSFSMRLKRIEKSIIGKAVKRTSAILGLDQLLARFPRQLSGGQRQRVAMGRAIVRDPKVFLFDEPLSNLDAKLRVQMRTEIKELHQRLRTTTIYVTHDQIEAMTMADKIVVMQNGVIEQMGAPLELYDHPANLFVAAFIGSPSMNLFPGVGQQEGKALVFRTPEGVAWPLPSGIKLGSEHEVVYGIRPEDIMIDSTNGVPATVSVLEPTGAETLVLAKTATSSAVVVARDRLSLKPGDVVALQPNLERVHLFDQKTGNRIHRD